LSRHSRWRDRTILSRQREWCDKVFYIENAIYVTDVVASMHMTRQRYLVEGQFRKIFLEAIIIKILSKKGLKIKKSYKGLFG
jgi:hypothetical protein